MSKEIKIIALSDTHGYHQQIKIPKCDILIFAGDWSTSGSITQTTNFIDWIKNQPAKHIIVTAGNHDKFCQWYPDLAEEYFRRAGIKYLNGNRILTVEGITIFGFPNCPIFGNWAFNTPEDTIFEIANRGKEANIIVTHTPPCGVLDETWWDGGLRNIGSPGYYKSLENLHPTYIIFGHNHKKGRKILKYKNNNEIDHQIRCYNVSLCNNNYDLVWKPTVITIK